MSKHTPGPWKRIAIGKRQVISSEHGWLVELPERGEPETDLQAKRLEADYTLMAAAPELLLQLRNLIDALKGSSIYYDSGRGLGHALAAARAAIAKAESPTA